jgi:hypothetical protein
MPAKIHVVTIDQQRTMIVHSQKRLREERSSRIVKVSSKRSRRQHSTVIFKICLHTLTPKPFNLTTLCTTVLCVIQQYFTKETYLEH